jgi:hypothetical protein
MVVVRKIAPHYVSAGLPTFLFTVMVGLPASVLTAWLFAGVFELPLQTEEVVKGRAADGSAARGWVSCRPGGSPG